MIDLREDWRTVCLGMMAEYPSCSPVKVIRVLENRCEGEKLPSVATIRRYMDSWKAENASQFLAYSDPDAWKNKRMVAFGKTDEKIHRLYQQVQADSTPADILLTDGRYTIVGMIDVFSRQMKLLVSKTSKATAIAALLRHWVLDFGVPEVLKTDNGKDYVSNHMTRVLFDLGIEQTLCPPFQPWHKPYIERALGTFSHDLLELLPGFAGHNVTERQQIRSRQSFGERMYTKSKEIELKLTPVALQEFCDNWCAGYHHRPHSGLDGKTPFEIVTNWQQPIKRVENDRALDLLLAEAPGRNGRYTIRKEGLVIQENGIKIEYIAPGLGARVGDKVQVRYDPIDLGRMYVFSEHFEFICIACNPERTGISRQELAMAAKHEQDSDVAAFKTEIKKIKKAANVKAEGKLIASKEAIAAGKVVPIFQRTESHQPHHLLSAEDAAKAASEIIPVARERTAADAVALAEVTAQVEAKEQQQSEAMDHEQRIRWRDKQIAKLAEVFLGNAEMHLNDEHLIDVARYATHGPGAGVMKIYVPEERLPAFRRWMAAFLVVEEQAV
jgi:putative transposase